MAEELSSLTLPADAQGFLTGDRIGKDELLSEWEGINDRLDAINAGVSGIAALLKAGITTAPATVAEAPAKPVAPRAVTPRPRRTDQPRDALGRFMRREDAGKPAQKVAPAPVIVNVIPPVAAVPAVPASRGEDTPRRRAPQKPAEKPQTKRTPPGRVPPVETPKDRAERTGGAKTGTSEKPAPRVRVTPPRVRRTGETVEGAKPEKPAEPKPRRAVSAKARERAQEQAEAATRDAHGRFIGKGGAHDTVAEGFSLGDTTVGRVAEKIGEAVADASEGVGEADPAVQAMQEAVAPLSRGLSFIADLRETFGESREAGLLSKILGTVKGWRKTSSAFEKAAEAHLGEIEENSEKAGAAQSGGGLLGMARGGLAGMGGLGSILGAFAKRVPLLGAVAAGAKGLWDIFSSESDDTLTRAEKDKRTGKAAGSMTGGIAGALGGAKLGALAGSFAGPIGAAIGGTVGSVAGLFFGEKAGDVLGEKVGEWTTSLRDADIPGKIAGAWTAMTAGISAAWTGATNTFTALWQAVPATLTAAWDKSVAGFDAAWAATTETFSAKWQETVDGLRGAWEKAKEVGNKAKEAVTNTEAYKAISGALENGLDTLKGGASTVYNWIMPEQKKGVLDETPQTPPEAATGKDSLTVRPDTKRMSTMQDLEAWKIGQTSEKFESGGRGAGTISSGRGDLGGKSYGTYQLSRETGTLAAFLSQTGYGAKLEEAARANGAEISADAIAKRGARPKAGDQKAFDEAWKTLAQNDPEFAAAQHNFIKETHYDPAMKALAGRGIDLSKRGKAVQDMLWSTAVQFGAGSEKSRGGAAGMIEKALMGKDVSKLTDAQIIEAVQNYKIANNAALFRSSSAAVREGTLNRAIAEKADLLNIAGLEAAGATPQTVGGVETPPVGSAETFRQYVQAGKTVTATSHVPTVPRTVPELPRTEPTAAVTTPLAGNVRPPAVNVRIDREEGQDVRDRTIAHIATGGVS